MTRLPRTIVIVGAGFSGAVVAINLLRSSNWRSTPSQSSQSRQPLRIVLVERVENVARGAAYADRDYPYLLNVPAGRMSLNSRDPLEFLKYAQQRIASATEDDFLPRALYGEYLSASLDDSEQSAPLHVTLHRVRGEVCDIVHTEDSYRVELHDGTSFVADDVVLALGNPRPGKLPGTDALAGSPRYVTDPWSAPAAFKPNETVLVVGTGLSMADTVIAGSDATNHNVTFHAISRHGLVPPSQTAFRHAGCADESVALLRAASSSARRLFRAVRHLTTEVEARGGDWREAITCVRNIAPTLWQRLPIRERQRFLRHARPYWEIHRHRLPQDTLAKLMQLRRDNRFHIHAGRLTSFALVGEKIRVTWRPRGKEEPQTFLVDRVVNCTGADYNPTRSRDPLMRSLLSQGLVSSDALGLGLRTGFNCALIDSRNRISPNLYYIGPMLRADHWECTAAQELRVHAERLAQHLLMTVPKPVSRLTEPPRTAVIAAAYHA